MNFGKKIIKKLFKHKINSDFDLPIDFEKDIGEIIRKVSSFSMTSPERLYSLLKSVDYVVKNKIEGDIVECGVWRGGSMMATAYRLMHLKASRMLYLFDTFDGMSPASSEDVSIIGENAKSYLDLKKKTEDDTMWAYAPIERVKENLYGTQYPKDKIHFIKGKVENTLPHKKLKKIAILRLDTDWYNSTLHELETLFPLLVKGGVLIIDDYGHWQGARKAVDEYIKRKKVKIFLNRVDYTCRLAIKQ